jgi:adenine-specific DNA glycosylase
VRRWKKEKKVRKYPTTEKKKKKKKKRDCIIACFLNTKVTKNQAIEALIVLATWACKAFKNQTTTKRNRHKIPAKTKKETKTLLFVSLFSSPRADKRQRSAPGRTLGI